jgi:ribose 5-phosphate isomerase RpiB
MLCRGESAGVVVLADRCHWIACRANRNHYVRAAVVTDARAADQAREELGANLFCVPPTGMAQFALLNLLRSCGKVFAPKPPGDWNR